MGQTGADDSALSSADQVDLKQFEIDPPVKD